MTKTLPLAAALALLPACDDFEHAEPGAELVEFRGGAGQGGPIFNTNMLLNTEVSAVDTTGAALGGVVLAQVEVLSGTLFTAVDPGSLFVMQGTLFGTVSDELIQGDAFAFSRWTFLVDGQPVAATLTSVETSADAGLYDPLGTLHIRHLDPARLVYTFTYKPTDTSPPVSTCTADSIGGARMVLFGDLMTDPKTGVISERPDTIHFGCLSSALGKAALWGYAPDSPTLTSLSLPAFTTAVRTVRADYCGDGTSYTFVGKQLTLRDRWAINKHEPYAFTTEALWKIGAGAMCVSRLRTTGQVLAAPLACGNGKTIPLCGSEAFIAKKWNLGSGDIWTKIP